MFMLASQTCNVQSLVKKHSISETLKDEAQTALFKDPVLTAQ